MTEEQTLKYFISEIPLQVSKELFNKLQLQGSNSFDIERICRGFGTVDLYHFDSGEVVHDVSISELIQPVKN